MTGRSPGLRLAAILALTAALGLAALARLRPGLDRYWGDEVTYVAMASSLAEDRDLVFDALDLERERRSGRLGQGVLTLQEWRDRVAYSKPVLYPLLAAPLYPAAGPHGLVAINVLALALGLVAALRSLGRRSGAGPAALALVSFAGTSALLPYLAWRTSDALEVGLTLCGLSLALGRAGDEAAPPGRSLGRAVAGGFLLGLAASARLPQALFAAAPVVDAALARRWRRAAALAAAAAAAFLLLAALQSRLGGAANPYRAVRSGFNQQTGYPVGPDGDDARRRFETNLASNTLSLAPVLQPSRSAYSALYFLIGRHTGVAFYFPFALALAWAVGRAPDRRGVVLAASALALVAFLLVWQPGNYFGGESFVGNRYFLPAYAALLLAPRRLPGGRALVLVWAVAVLAFVSALVSVGRTRRIDHSSQSHARAGLYRWLPYESSALEVDGRADRYWSGDLVRIVDPFARAHRQGFRLRAGAEGSELLVAHRRPYTVLRFLLTSRAPEVEVVASDWLKRRRLRPEPSPGGVHTVLAFHPSPAWRRHSFWWPGDARYQVHALRLELRTPDGRPAVADLRYLGDGAVLEQSFPRQVLLARLPAEGRSGAGGACQLRVRNRSGQVWAGDAVLPVSFAYRLFPDGDRARRLEGRHLPLAAPVAPGAVAEVELPVVWPEEPGRYLLEVDLVLEQVAWFGDRLGEPVGRGWVEVRRAVPEGAGRPQPAAAAPAGAGRSGPGG